MISEEEDVKHADIIALAIMEEFGDKRVPLFVGMRSLAKIIAITLVANRQNEGFADNFFKMLKDMVKEEMENTNG